MKIKGTVSQVLTLQSGQSKNGEWKKQDIVVETEGQYPKKVCISLWGDLVGTANQGAIVDVSINIESREYNGNWYTDVKAWKVDLVGGQAQSTPQQTQSKEEPSDLPF